MAWEFEHWDNGKVYLHCERWERFRSQIEKYGGDYPHNWDHQRIFFRIHTPRNLITDVPVEGDDDFKYKIENIEDSFSVIYEPYPAFFRSNIDPEGWASSWHVFAENKNNGEPLTILETSDIYAPKIQTGFFNLNYSTVKKNKFCYFRNQYWILDSYRDYGIGPHQPKKIKKNNKYRNIFDPFEGSW